MDENDTLPQGGTVTDSADDYTTSVDALADILDDPLDADTEKETVSADDTDNDPEPEAQAEDEGLDDVLADDSDDDAPEEAQDGPDDELKGGRIAPQSAKVKLPDGSLTTVDELLKGYHRQSDYTRKMQSLSNDRKEMDAARESVSQTEQQLKDQLTRVNQMMDAWKPKPPDNVQDDPMAWINYQQQLANWDQWQQQLDQQTAEQTQKADQERTQSAQKRLAQEASLMVEKIPALADDSKRAAFFGEASKVMAEYGFSKEEVSGVMDHRMVVIMRDLMKAKRIAQKAPQVKAEVKTKPKMVSGGTRQSANAGRTEQASKRLGRLHETGSLRDGVASLMDLDL